MNRKRLAVTLLFCLVVFAGVGSAYIHAEISQYQGAAPCTELRGIPAVLQSLKMLPKSDCKFDSQRGRCFDLHQCTIPAVTAASQVSQGTCTTVGNNCVCLGTLQP